MDKEIWALRIQELVRAIEATQTNLIISNEDPEMLDLFERWRYLLMIFYKMKTGEDYADPFETATH